jgi:hypothetical protein
MGWLLLGQGLFVFAVLALSGPGRLCVSDAQTRFEVGRSLVEHGDSLIRDSRIWFNVFPGRDNQNYTTYRFPQSVLAAGAIVVADQTGPVNEGRRHFFFVLTSALAAALLSIFYTIGFRWLGCSPRSALLWGLGGIFCTPNWYYGTSTFDDILGSLTVVAAGVVGIMTRERRLITGAVVAGLLMGLAFNCKQPLGAFVLVVLALHDNPQLPRRQRILGAAIIVVGLLIGVGVEHAYDYYKYPFDKNVVHAKLLENYAAVYAGSPLTALACFAVSPGCGIFWYCPPVILGMCGVAQLWKRQQRPLGWAMVLTSAAFIGFHCFISFFKGDLSWGPRYLTPWFALLWLFAPLGAGVVQSSPLAPREEILHAEREGRSGVLARWVVTVLLSLGIVVQVLALSVDPFRLCIERGLSAGFGADQPALYFNPSISNLWERPREIVEILGDKGTAQSYSPADSPTSAVQSLDPPYLLEKGRPAIERYAIFRGFRPWWSNQWMLPEADRPVNLTQMILSLAGIAALGLLCMLVAVRKKE